MQYDSRVDRVIYENVGLDGADIDRPARFADLAMAMVDQAGLDLDEQDQICKIIRRSLKTRGIRWSGGYKSKKK